MRRQSAARRWPWKNIDISGASRYDAKINIISAADLRRRRHFAEK